MIISQYDFKIYKDFETGSERFPALKEGAFSMSLQAGESFYNAIVRYDFVFNALNIEFYDEQNNLFQTRFRCTGGINLFYLQGYYLVFKEQEGVFIFGSGSENEVL